MVNKFDVDALCKGFCLEEMQEGWTKGARMKDLR
jgi:hypothetical protein